MPALQYSRSVQRGGSTRPTHATNALVPRLCQRMLTLTLRSLERDGSVVRKVHPSIPPSVEYGLTELDRTFLLPLSTVAEWADRHGSGIDEARVRYDATPS
ncbi:winged helix-turn-helix transcriptional regulator [Saccharopolyspora sp. 5N102]|uniref:winged helix-turn-helix transcriptional regulator n=1 Tax=Saccharopolyspora sp. 5N102 TaxID=3375155 RepID=UPI0037AE901D